MCFLETSVVIADTSRIWCDRNDSVNILVLHSELGALRGGGENFTRHLFAAFAARGHGVSAAFTADFQGRYRYCLPKGFVPIPIPGWWSRNLGQSLLFGLGRGGVASHAGGVLRARVQESLSWRVIRWHNRRFARRVMTTLSGHISQFDAVYVHGDVELATAMSKYRPTILRLPGPVSSDYVDSLRRVHVVCANGDALSRLRAFLPDEVLELPLGIDARLFCPGPRHIRQQLGWSPSDVVVGYVGRLTHLKGVDLLAAAFRLVSRSVASVRLVVVGQGPAGRALRSILAREIASGVVRLQPDVCHRELPAWYRALDLFVMPSRYENYSNAVVEALACGVPFLGSDVGGNRTLAESTGGGWVFDADSAAALASALEARLGDAVELKRRGDVGHRHVSGRYSWARSAEVLEDMCSTARLRCFGREP